MILTIQKNKHFKMFIFCGLLTFLTGCAKPTFVSQKVTMPARIDGLKQSKKIAFKQFKGDDTGVYTQKIETFFRNIKVDNKPYFEVLERDALDSILEEQKLSQSGILDETVTIEVGTISSIDTLVVGSLIEPTISQTKTKEARSNYNPCGYYKTNKKGKLVCVSKIDTYYVDCYQTSVAFQFNIKFLNLSKAKSNYANNYQASTKNSYCSDKGRPSDTNLMSEQAFSQAINLMRKDVAPYSETVNIKLLGSDDGSRLSKNKKANTLFESGVKMIEGGNVQAGCNSFKKTSSIYNQSSAVYYNLGVCSELVANWDRALKYYKAAQTKLTTEPLPEIPQAIKRIQNRMVQQQQVNQQSRTD